MQTFLSYARAAKTRFDALVHATERSITLLKERRSAFITAAVMGQIDLRDAATAPTPSETSNATAALCD